MPLVLVALVVVVGVVAIAASQHETPQYPPSYPPPDGGAVPPVTPPGTTPPGYPAPPPPPAHNPTAAEANAGFGDVGTPGTTGYKEAPHVFTPDWFKGVNLKEGDLFDYSHDVMPATFDGG